MNLNQPSETQSRAQREAVLAAFACLGCSGLMFGIVTPALQRLHLGWAESPVCVLLPLGLTFVLLYGSSIHREMAKLTRSAYLLLVSVMIFTGTALFFGAIAFFATAFANMGRGEPGH
jgi:hypothetical protein